MLKGLIQRLLGALVLIGLLVILAPAIFTGGRDHPMASATLEPPVKAPEPPSYASVLDTPVDSIEMLEVDQELESSKHEEPGVDSEGHLKAWTLQLASFSQEDNAKRLVQKLQALGYSSYSRDVMGRDNQPLYRVFVGPEVHANELNEIKSRLEAELNLAGVIVRF